MNRLATLLVGLEDATLSEAELGELIGMLDDPEARAKLVSHLSVSEGITAYFLEHAATREPSRLAPKSTTSRMYWPVRITAMAATLAAVIGIGFLAMNLVRETPVGRLTEIRGAVIVAEESKLTAASLGAHIRSGTALVNPQDGDEVVLTCEDKSTLRFSGHGRMSVTSTPDGTTVSMTRGRLDATIARQSEGRPMVFVTPHAEATVLGTRFTLMVDSNTTRLDVAEGLVRLANAADKSVFSDVSTGQYAIAAAGVELKAKTAGAPLPPETVRVIENHEGPMRWKQNPWSARMEFASVPEFAHDGARSLKVVYRQDPTDSKAYGQLIHPISLRHGDSSLRFHMYVSEFNGNASWNIQLMLKDESCWMIGGRPLKPMQKGWNTIDLDLTATPQRATTPPSMEYDLAAVDSMILSLCTEDATIFVDGFEIVSSQPALTDR